MNGIEVNAYQKIGVGGRRFEIEDQQLLLHEHRFCDDGTRAAATGQSGDSHQQMQKQDGQIAQDPPGTL
jgi:hypothetical protein